MQHMRCPVANRRRYINLQEEYIKDEQRSLKRELVRAQEEIKRIQSVPLVIGQFMEAIDQKYVLTLDIMFHSGANLSVLASYSHQRDPTTSSASFLPLTANSSSPPRP